MIKFFIKWILYIMSVIFTAWLIPGIKVDNFISAMFVCIILALINTFIKPLIEIIAFPVTVITLGIFSLAINALMFMLTRYIVQGFEVESFFSALLGSVLLSVLSLAVSKL